VCGDADTATETKLRDESASLGVERSGEFDLDYDGFATVPLSETVQPIGKIFKRSVLRQHDNMNESAPSSNATVTRLGRESS